MRFICLPRSASVDGRYLKRYHPAYISDGNKCVRDTIQPTSQTVTSASETMTHHKRLLCVVVAIVIVALENFGAGELEPIQATLLVNIFLIFPKTMTLI